MNTPNYSRLVFPVGIPTAETVQYLTEVSGQSPLPMFSRSPLFLCSPVDRPMRVPGCAPEGTVIYARPSYGAGYYNPVTQLTEFDVVCVLTNTSYRALLPGMSTSSLPYFVLAVDPNRSTAARRFCVNVLNVLMDRGAPLEYELAYLPMDHEAARSFNPEAGSQDDVGTSWA